MTRLNYFGLILINLDLDAEPSFGVKPRRGTPDFKTAMIEWGQLAANIRTPKKPELTPQTSPCRIPGQPQNNFGCTLFGELRSWDTRALPTNLQRVAKFSHPKKFRNRKFQTSPSLEIRITPFGDCSVCLQGIKDPSHSTVKPIILGFHCHAMKNKNANHSIQKD